MLSIAPQLVVHLEKEDNTTKCDCCIACCVKAYLYVTIAMFATTIIYLAAKYYSKISTDKINQFLISSIILTALSVAMNYILSCKDTPGADCDCIAINRPVCIE
jgi:hypothetical protein